MYWYTINSRKFRNPRYHIHVNSENSALNSRLIKWRPPYYSEIDKISVQYLPSLLSRNPTKKTDIRNQIQWNHVNSSDREKNSESLIHCIIVCLRSTRTWNVNITGNFSFRVLQFCKICSTFGLHCYEIPFFSFSNSYLFDQLLAHDGLLLN